MLCVGCGSNSNEKTGVKEPEIIVEDTVINEEVHDEVAPKKVVIDDYYEYVNSEWISSVVLTQDMISVSRSTEYEEELNKKVEDFLNNPPDNIKEDVTMSKVLEFYNQLDDKGLRDNQSMTYIKSVLDRIESIKNVKDLVKVMKDDELSLFNPILGQFYGYADNGKYALMYRPKTIHNIYYNLTEEEKSIIIDGYTQELILLGYSEEKAVEIVTNAYKINDAIENYYKSTNTSSWGYYTLNELNDSNDCRL